MPGLLLAFAAGLATAGLGAPVPAAAPLVVPARLLQHINAAIGWYHAVQAGSDWLSQPSDVYYWDTERALAAQALQATFTSARAEAPLAAPSAPAAASPSSTAAEQQRLSQLARARSERIAELQREVADLSVRIRAAPDAAAQAPLIARQGALAAEIQFLAELRGTIEKLGGQLGGGPSADAASLAGQIESLRASVADELAAVPAPAATNPAAAQGVDSGGLIARTGALLRLAKYRGAIEQLIGLNDALAADVAAADAPVRAAIRAAVQAGDRQAQELSGPDETDFERARRSFAGLSARFHVLAGVLVPLAQERLLLERSRRNLQSWRDSIGRRESDIVRYLVVKAVTVAVIVAAILGLSDLWRRMSLSYIADERRRRQFLIVRRFVTAALMLIAIATQFVSDFGSLAAFAGLVTAGIAVALQPIISSIAAYFFLIGRHGLKVGDRVAAGGVTGEVADMGLVRFYVKELAASGPELHPTGRIVSFPNSVIFQANPVFKQLPGTEYTWHEAAVTVAAAENAAAVREKILRAVLAAYEEYRPLLEQPRAKAEKVSGLKTELPRPYAQLRARDRELDLAVGYPVGLQHLSETDQIVLKHVTDAMAADAALAAGISGPPRIGAAARG